MLRRLSLLTIPILALIALFAFSGPSQPVQAGEDKCITTVGCDPIIYVTVDTNPERVDPDFQFRSAKLGDFTLEDTNSGRTRKFTVDPGRYAVSQDEALGWNLDDIDCDAGNHDAEVSLANERVIFDVEYDDVVHCTFVNELPATPTTAPTATSTSIPAATSTPVPVATAAIPPAQVIVEPQVINVTVINPPVAPQAPQVIAPVLPQPIVLNTKPGTIKPPSTGSAGMAGICEWVETYAYVPGHYEYRWKGVLLYAKWIPGHYEVSGQELVC